MPKVTDKEYQLEGFLIEKMDLIIKRITESKLDAVILIDGDEGFGKTGISILLSYYLASKTGREFSLDNIFFDPEEFINKVNSTRNNIFIWDEAALGGLASNWQARVQQRLIQTLMTCRFRQHIIFFNCPKFYRLNQYFITDRALGLVHVYSPDELKAGQISYYKKDKLEEMLGHWFSKKKKPYKKFHIKRLRGHFIDAFNEKLFKDGAIIDESSYDKKKLYFTEKLLTEYPTNKVNEKLLNLQYGITQLIKDKGLSQAEVSPYLNVDRSSLSLWSKIPEKYPEIIKKST